MKRSSRSLLSRDSSSKSEFSAQDNAFESAMDEALADDETYAVDIDDDANDIFKSIQKHDNAIATSNLSSLDRRRFGLPVVEEGLSDGTVISKASLGMRDAYKKIKSLPQNLGRKKVVSNRSLLSEGRVSDRIPTRDLSRKGFKTEKSRRDFDEESEQLSLPSRSARISVMGDDSVVSSGSMSHPSYPSKPSLNHRPPSEQSFRTPVFSDKSVASSMVSRPSLPRDDSLKSTSSYRIPMPTMPFETKRGTLVRIAMGIIFLGLSITFTLLGAGNGQVGMSISSWLYNNLILDETGGTAVIDAPSSPTSSNGSHLFETLRGLERSYEPNINGIADYHIPLVVLNGADLDVQVGLKPHVMSENHFIKYIWLRDVDANSIVLAKEFQPMDESPPSLVAKVPRGVRLQPYVFCILHELWIGEPFEVNAEN